MSGNDHADWKEYADDDGISFYHHHGTGVSTYDPPPHLVAAAMGDVPLMDEEDFVSEVRSALHEIYAGTRRRLAPSPFSRLLFGSL